MNDMQITPPPMPEPARIEAAQFCDDGIYFADHQLTDRDQQWLAIVKEAVLAEREECAKACEELELKERISGQWTAGWCEGTDDCAAAIRSRSTT